MKNYLKSKEDVMLTVFVFSVFTAFVSAGWLFLNADSTKYEATLEQIGKVRTKQVELEGLLKSNIETVGNSNVEFKSVKSLVETATKNCDLAFEKQGEAIYKCGELQKKYSELEEKLAKKKTVVYVKEVPPQKTVPIELSTPEPPKKGKGVKALIK